MKSPCILFLLLLSSLTYGQLIWVETELFEDRGGWINETQFVDQMGSPYLMAHGLGQPVKDAHTTVEFPETGEYHFWVRTKDWVPTDMEGPGKFRVLINDIPYGPLFGADGIKSWHWVYGGTVDIGDRQVRLSLKDLTGMNGRCDVICFSKEKIVLPDALDNLVMGSSNQWQSVREDIPSDFPVEPWMFEFSEEYHFPLTRSRWDWESGFDNLHTVDQAEEIRDLNLCAIYSNWAFLKTFKKERFSHYRLSEIQHVTGKRESYRLMGDHILTEWDVVKKAEYPDATVTTTWGIDLHYPHPENSKRFPGMEFIAYAEHPFKQQDVYTFPYRCLYSRNVSNLFMAGRNISVTHIALGTVRVQRCTGMMGEVVGLAAYLCQKRNALPRDIYEKYLDELLQLVKTECIE